MRKKSRELCDIGRKGRKIVLDALLVTDNGIDIFINRKHRALSRRNKETRLIHE